MTPPTSQHDNSAPLEALGDDGNHTMHANGAVSDDDNNARGDEETTAAAAPLPSVEDMEDLILEAYNNMQSDGEHIFLPSDVASKLQLIAELVKGAGYTSDDLVSNSSESNQEETARALLPSDQHTAPRSAASSAPSSPPTDHLSITEYGYFPHVSHLRLDDHQAALPAPRDDRTPIEPLVLENNNFVAEETSLSAAAIAHNNEFAPALSPVQEIAEDLLSISDFGSVAERPQETLTPPKPSAPASRERSPQVVEKPKSMLRKPEVHRKSSVPARPSSVKSQDSNASATRSRIPRPKTETQPPPPSRERSKPSTYEQRREAAQKLREEKAQRELQAREAVRKQREETKRNIEAAQQKETAEKRERVARLRVNKDQRKGPVKSAPKTR